MLIKNILITGAKGFIGKNLSLGIDRNFPDINIHHYTSDSNHAELEKMASKADLIFHLAGVNRPKDAQDFYEVNTGLTEALCKILMSSKKKTPIVFTSTTQALETNDYGKSKLNAENYLEDFSKINNSEVYIYRLNNIFGKWCKPNYNSVVATFCHNISKGLDITINDPDSILKLTYIDDVVSEFLELINNQTKAQNPIYISNYYETTVGNLASDIMKIKEGRKNHYVESVGVGYKRSLYATYLSYIEPGEFISDLKSNHDDRGNFVEMLKTENSGQVSFFSAHPGITRGSHFHHTKNEKFLVISGKAKFKFKNMENDEYCEFVVKSNKPQIVETIPGWAHDITNIGDSDMLVMLWANEIYDDKKPDTFWEDVKK